MNCIKIGLHGKLILRYFFSREYDFLKTFSPTENQFSRKTYFYTIASRKHTKLEEFTDTATWIEITTVE